MPAPRKTWLPHEDQSQLKPTIAPSPAQILADPSGSLELSPSNWGMAPVIKALLGRDNRKISPTRTESLLKKLDEFILLLDAIEAEGVKFTQDMKDQLVARATRDLLTIKPPAHPQSILCLQSHCVDQYLLEKDWPIRATEKQARYHENLRQHLPALFAELADCQGCNPGCPRRVSPDADDIRTFAAINSLPTLRDAIVAFHHGIAPSSMRGARAGRRIRRHRKE